MAKKRNLKTSLVMSLFLLAIVSTAGAEIIYVDADASVGGNGTTWATAYKYLQDALYKPPTGGDEIWVAAGTYKPDEDEGGNVTPGARSATFQLINGAALYGGFASGETTLEERDWETNETILSGDLNGDDIGFTNNGENSYHVVTGSGTDATAILDSFTVVAGNANIGSYPDPSCLGAGMYNCYGSPTVTNCTFSGSSASWGGGMHNQDYSNPTVTNCTFSGNSADFGGGMGNGEYSSPAVTNCTFSGNSAVWDGGGMYNFSQSSPTLANCTFSGNSAEGEFARGGGMSNIWSSPTVTNCRFIGNSGRAGAGGMYNLQSSPTVTNCTFSGNSTSASGGGMWNSGSSSSPTVTNCTFSGNSADYGGGMYNRSSSNATLTNCILWGNTAPSGSQIYNDGTSSATVSYSNVLGGWSGTGNIDADPLFADAANGDYHLKSRAGRWLPSYRIWVIDDVNSPCIDTGDPGSPVGDEPAPNGGRINMGAFGGTAEASKSGVCTHYSPGDINADCRVDFIDFSIMALHWLEDNRP